MPTSNVARETMKDLVDNAISIASFLRKYIGDSVAIESHQNDRTLTVECRSCTIKCDAWGGAIEYHVRELSPVTCLNGNRTGGGRLFHDRSNLDAYLLTCL